MDNSVSLLRCCHPDFSEHPSLSKNGGSCPAAQRVCFSLAVAREQGLASMRPSLPTVLVRCLPPRPRVLQPFPVNTTCLTGGGVCGKYFQASPLARHQVQGLCAPVAAEHPALLGQGGGPDFLRLLPSPLLGPARAGWRGPATPPGWWSGLGHWRVDLARRFLLRLTDASTNSVGLCGVVPSRPARPASWI